MSDVAGSSGSGGTPAATPAQSGAGGRKNASVRTYFTHSINRRNNRPVWSDCNFCGQHLINTRPEKLTDHLLGECSKIDSSTRQEISKQRSSAFIGGNTVPLSRSAVKRAGSASFSSAATGEGGAGAAKRPKPLVQGLLPVQAMEQESAEQLSSKLLLWAVVAGVPFNAFNSPYFVAFIAACSRNRYIPPGEAATPLRP